MRIRTKTLLVFSLTLFFLVLTLYLSVGSIVFEEFEDLEYEAVNEDMGKALDYIDQSIYYLEVLSTNWAAGSDTYNFIRNNNSDYIESKLANSNLKEMRLNVVVFLDESGDIVYNKAYNPAIDEEIPFPSELVDILSEDNSMLPSSENNYAPSGLVMLSDKPLIFSSRPIYDSAANSSQKGTLIIGSFFDQASLDFFTSVHKTPLTYYIISDTSNDPEIKRIMDSIGNDTESIYTEPLNHDTLMAYTVVSDIHGKPALLMEMYSPRTIFQNAKTAFYHLFYVIIFAVLIYGVIGTIFLETSVLSRLSSLTGNVDDINEDSLCSNKIVISGDDEISSLGSSINHLVERIDERENLLCSIIESISESVIVIDENYRMTHFKSKFINLWEIPEDIIKSMDGRKLLLHLKDRMIDFDKIISRLQKYHMSKEFNMTMVQFKDGIFFEVLSFPLIQNEKVIGRVLSFKDVTDKKKAESLILEQEHKYRLLFEHSNDAIFIVKDEIVQDLNNKACDMLHKSPEEIIGRHVGDFYAEEQLTIINNILRDALKDSFSKGEISSEGLDGILDMEVSATVVDLETGLTQVIVRDITERKEVERLEIESRERMSLILNNINCGVLVIDAHSREVIDINPTAQDILGLKKKDVLGKKCHNFICPGEKGRCPVIDFNKKIDKSEYVLKRVDGTQVPVLKSVEQVKMGGRDILIESFVDITKIKETEDALMASKVYAETANRTKTEFLANMSHELRTPLNSVIGFSDLLLEGNFGQLNEKQKQFMSNISSSGNNLLNLINDILDISKIEAGTMKLFLDVFDVADLLSDTYLMMNPLAVGKGILLDIKAEPMHILIKADRVKLKQILYNIIGNAIKFTPENGTISVKVSTWDDFLNISVQDTGIGISPEDQAKLFKPFVQLDSACNRKYKGTGLGLALVKNLLELHGGDISVDSEPGKGSIFLLCLPLNIEKNYLDKPMLSMADVSNNVANLSTAENIIILKPEESDDTEPLILIVGDDAGSRHLLSEKLTDFGYRVVLVNDGITAVKIAEQLHPFVVTLDLVLQGTDGTEILKSLKSNDNISSIPVIVLSSGKRDVEFMDMEQVAEYLAKPVDFGHLQKVLSNIAAKKG